MYRIWLSVLGAGYLPLMPGTWGSAAAAAFFVGAAFLIGTPIWVGLIMLAAAVHGGLVTVAYGERLIAKYGPDPAIIVSDEQCGQAITYVCYLWMGQMVGGSKEILVFAGAGFILFRFFDIIKPPPVKQMERVQGAWGVLLDDVMAGIYANLALQGGWWLWRVLRATG
ncbi:MAG: hypothetical protein AMJ79_06405 [Phycisphaerae bacterium SM23_30]|nr:MAG: hypothetical protein AMJ79_06405 [Phycisphaerae bacterium SM23_30]